MDATTPTARTGRRLLPWLLAALIAGSLARLSTAPARAGAVAVPNGDVAALIQAINNANASPGADTIDLASGGTYTLTAASDNFNGATGLPRLQQGQITINGHGATIARGAAAPAFRILAITASATVVLNDLTIAGGTLNSDGSSNPSSGDNSSGGGIASDGSLTLNNTIIQNNAANARSGASGKPGGGDGLGGGIYSTGALTLNRSTVRNNMASAGAAIAGGTGGRAFGGGIFSTNSSVELHASTLAGNSASGGAGTTGDGGQAVGGGLYTFQSSAQSSAAVDSSTISGNRAAGGSSTSANNGSGSGGGIYASGGLTVQNSTVSANSASGDLSFGGAIFNETGSTTLSSTTISGNTAEGSAGKGGGYTQNSVSTSLVFKNTIIANNIAAAGSDCYKLSTFTSQGYNLVEDNSDCIFTLATGDQIGVDPKLGPLQNNGGATLTHALLAGSPAIDHGNPGGCQSAQGSPLANDQRGAGFPRSRDGDGDGTARCDVGAYELQPTAASTSTPTGTPPTATPTSTPTRTPTATPDTSKYHMRLPIVRR